VLRTPLLCHTCSALSRLASRRLGLLQPRRRLPSQLHLMLRVRSVFNASALWLSHMSNHGLPLPLSSPKICHAQSPSFAAIAQAMYSASAVDIAVTDSSFDIHITGVLYITSTMPVVLLRF
jgi:hypothetical protein